jgi:hypothetical protein
MGPLRVLALTTCLLLSYLSGAMAGGPYDGEWSGRANSADAQCKSAVVSLTVEGKTVTGQARFERDTPNIYGTVSEDGRFGATIGFQPITGRFTPDEFEGAFKSFGCGWTVRLQRAR